MTSGPRQAPPPASRAHTLTHQAAANRVARGLLRTPLLGRVVGRWLMTIYVVGRRTGRRYAVPVAYVRHGGQLLVGTAFGWARNLRTGEPVAVRFTGRLRTADVTVVTDEQGVVADLAVIARGNHRFAAFNGIALDAAGEPDPADLHHCWAAGSRTLRLTPR